MWLYAAFLRPGKPLRRRYGEWAVVTGATDGIGHAMAFRFVTTGLHLVLVGHSPDKLAAVSKELGPSTPGPRGSREPIYPEMATLWDSDMVMDEPSFFHQWQSDVMLEQYTEQQITVAFGQAGEVEQHAVVAAAATLAQQPQPQSQYFNY
ncbi:hypothetical protein GUJ93_ZPchr0011g28663 [Zizania palustris]|uniref:Uncharacterized protein n=1 Tax=Zizania palustris TaxID=103762 RepID=A0A8J6BS04_ZIZPA|nr:hypothetical protein GUJ93_ZPchr0011g28663 [Zizania palustris]